MRIYHTKAWKKVRSQALKRDKFCCVFCNASIKGTRNYSVDHILQVRDRPDLAFDVENLRGLCSSCDNKRHRGKSYVEGTNPVEINGEPASSDHPWNAGTF